MNEEVGQFRPWLPGDRLLNSQLSCPARHTGSQALIHQEVEFDYATSYIMQSMK